MLIIYLYKHTENGILHNKPKFKYILEQDNYKYTVLKKVQI
jgi:hypothetical protein